MNDMIVEYGDRSFTIHVLDSGEGEWSYMITEITYLAGKYQTHEWDGSDFDYASPSLAYSAAIAAIVMTVDEDRDGSRDAHNR